MQTKSLNWSGAILYNWASGLNKFRFPCKGLHYLFIYFFKGMSIVLLLNLSTSNQKPHYWNFPGGPAVKSLDYHAGDVGSVAGQRTKIPPGN